MLSLPNNAMLPLLYLFPCYLFQLSIKCESDSFSPSPRTRPRPWPLTTITTVTWLSTKFQTQKPQKANKFIFHTSQFIMLATGNRKAIFINMFDHMIYTLGWAPILNTRNLEETMHMINFLKNQKVLVL